MVATTASLRVEEIAHNLFEVLTHLSIAIPHGRRRTAGLKEAEFLTLAILSQHEPMIVGDIQRLLGILPAQMSRVIRSLEARDRPLIVCRINSQDKRKVNVCMTPAGTKALTEYQSQQLRGITELIQHLPTDEQEEMGKLLDRLHGLLERVPRA
jgi:DNA-binding MarR family transcriptional regulator